MNIIDFHCYLLSKEGYSFPLLTSISFNGQWYLIMLILKSCSMIIIVCYRMNGMHVWNYIKHACCVWRMFTRYVFVSQREGDVYAYIVSTISTVFVTFQGEKLILLLCSCNCIFTCANFLNAESRFSLLIQHFIWTSFFLVIFYHFFMNNWGINGFYKNFNFFYR